ncbi:MAG: myo-inosose-2 dehydratase [Spartobacteria bacterium]|nr:myo-inosose-2 dehydratase [Spartobacteria bacterium]
MFKKGDIQLGIAPIAWTNDDLPELGGDVPFEQCVSEMALAGYTGSEVGNKYPKDVTKLKAALELRGLQICNAWFSTHFTSKPLEETVAAFIEHRDFLHAMGAKVIGASEQGNSIQGQMDTPVLFNKPIFTEEEWNKVTTGLEKLAELAAEKDMFLSYHHHMGTGIQTMEEIDRLMADTKNVYLLYDTGHALYGGVDPLELVNKYADRIIHVHLKDIRKDVLKDVSDKKMSFLNSVKAGVFTVPGDGCIDFKPIFESLAKSGYKGWFVVEAEQDPAKANSLEYAIKARKYIKETAGI